MKTWKYMHKTLFRKHAVSPLAWEPCESDLKAETVIEYAVHFNPYYILKGRFGDVFYFRCNAGNISCASINPFKCIFETLEHESIGMNKYDKLKSTTRKKGLWQKL